jgi:hypothetical protein
MIRGIFLSPRSLHPALRYVIGVDLKIIILLCQIGPKTATCFDLHLGFPMVARERTLPYHRTDLVPLAGAYTTRQDLHPSKLEISMRNIPGARLFDPRDCTHIP